MSPNRREREYARRRHEDWLARRAERQERRRRLQQRLAVGGSVLAVLLAVGGVAWATGAFDRSDDESPQPQAQAAGECPAPTATAPAEQLSFESPPPLDLAEGRTWTAVLTTSCGEITAELDGAAAPQAVSSFVFLAQQGFYADTPCHRLTTEGIFVLQCGDPTGTGTGGPGYTIPDELSGQETYGPGTLAMAKTSQPDSGGSQFFIVYRNTPLPPQYTVFGRLDAAGLKDVQKLARQGSDDAYGQGDGHPKVPVTIDSVTTG